MKGTILAIAFAIATAGTAGAQVAEKPIRWTWIVTSCENWNCAAAALVLADGDKHTIVLPTGNDSRPWLILKRVEEGSVFIPEDEPYGCEIFEDVVNASTRFVSMRECHSPLMLNVPDGRAVVVSLTACSTKKQRAAR